MSREASSILPLGALPWQASARTRPERVLEQAQRAACAQSFGDVSPAKSLPARTSRERGESVCKSSPTLSISSMPVTTTCNGMRALWARRMSSERARTIRAISVSSLSARPEAMPAPMPSWSIPASSLTERTTRMADTGSAGLWPLRRSSVRSKPWRNVPSFRERCAGSGTMRLKVSEKCQASIGLGPATPCGASVARALASP